MDSVFINKQNYPFLAEAGAGALMNRLKTAWKFSLLFTKK